ncbi:MAG: DUF1028 domain-containing protein [Longimicrobiales bacterium]|nr:DUF1028 domain-containing protein [Longimicrobiales bacterium]
MRMRSDLRVTAFPVVVMVALAGSLVVAPVHLRAQVVPDVTVDPVSDYADDYLATFSIIALDRETGQLGMGVQSKAFGAGNRAMTAKGGVAMIAHQASANPMYGPMSIELIERGYSPEEALGQLVRSDEGRDRRQNAIIDIEGRTAAWTGASTNAWAGHHCGVDYCAQGNILAGSEVVQAMVASFEASSGALAERLMDALDAAQAAGGDARGMQSGAILVVAPRVRGAFHDRVVDIRVDDHRQPLAELRRILDLQRSGEMLREINPMLQAGDLDGALEWARAAVAKSADNDNAHVALANVQLRSGDREGAMTSLRTAVGLNPGRRTTLPRDSNFAAIHQDPDFLGLIG